MTNPGSSASPTDRETVPLRDQRDGGHGERGPRPDRKSLVVRLLLAACLLGTAGFAALNLAPHGSPGPSVRSNDSTGDASVPPGPGASPGGWSPGGPSAGPGSTTGWGSTTGPGSSPSAPAPPVPTGDLAMPIVPVVDFWSTDGSISMQGLTAALQGRDSGYSGVIVPADDRAAIQQALGTTIASSVQSGDVAAIESAVKGGALGLLRASDVGPTVRALALGGASLFGETRIDRLSDWPLVVTVQAPIDRAWDPSTTWTMVAGGDMTQDRGVRNTVLVKGKGIDYPFAGGTAVVTGHYCCSPSAVKDVVPSYRRTGNSGVVRQLIKGADLAIANLENPIPNNPQWHLSGYTFGGPPQTLPMLTHAGIDWVTIANNHIKDYGAVGIAQTIANLHRYGIPFGGAGKGIAQAGQISYLAAKGTRVAIVACLAFGPAVQASGSGVSGALPCDNSYVVPRIQEARQHADLVIVFAHWGREYDRNPLKSQRKLAAAWVAAGAGLIIGSHTHYFGALEEIDGCPVIYSLGNFIYDQYWSTNTMESAIPEMTFEGNRLVQIRLHPDIILDQAQPNFLNPATDDGKVLMDAIRAASVKLGW